MKTEPSPLIGIIMRVGRWAIFPGRGAVLVVAGITVLVDAAQALGIFVGIAVVMFARVRGLGDTDYGREPRGPLVRVGLLAGRFNSTAPGGGGYE